MLGGGLDSFGNRSGFSNCCFLGVFVKLGAVGGDPADGNRFLGPPLRAYAKIRRVHAGLDFSGP
jgi:hypothetical protein